jgi:hypothetical protein
MNTIRRIDETLEPVATEHRDEYEHSDPMHDDQGIVWRGDPALCDEDQASEAVYDILRRNRGPWRWDCGRWI